MKIINLDDYRDNDCELVDEPDAFDHLIDELANLESLDEPNPVEALGIVYKYLEQEKHGYLDPMTHENYACMLVLSAIANLAIKYDRTYESMDEASKP